MARSPSRRPEGTFHGFLNVDKPLGMTSFDVIARLRRLLGVRRLGHAGTLDPQASGVLPVAVGHATRLLEFLDQDKSYRATLCLGVTTDTLDAAGQETGRRPVPSIDPVHLRGLLDRYLGWQDQVPPMASAIHHQGRRLHELFREGKTVELEPRRVRFDRLEVLALEPPRITLEVDCGGGTYVRALARDLGEDLGCGAHLEALVRTRSGGFTLDTACTLDEIAARADDEGALRALLLGARVGLQHMPCVELDASQVTRLRHGLRASCEAAAALAPGEPVLGLGPAGEVIGVVEVDPQGMLRARKILADSL